jgi:hypothetical protein
MARQFWWPKSLGDQQTRVKDIKEKIGGYQVPLGLTLAEVTEIEDLCTAIIEAYEFHASTDATQQAVTEWRDQVWYGTPVGDAVSPAPIFAVKGAVTFTRGSITQLFKWRENILTRDGYTEAIGEDLGFIGPEEEAPDLGTFKPTLKADAAQQGGFALGVTIGNRGKSDQWVLSAALVGSTAWQQLGTFTGKTANAAWPGTGNDPITIQLRVQLRRDNANYGQPSDIVLVTVIP